MFLKLAVVLLPDFPTVIARHLGPIPNTSLSCTSSFSKYYLSSAPLTSYRYAFLLRNIYLFFSLS